MPRRVLVLVVPPIDELDLVGPVEVFGTANRVVGGNGRGYAVELRTAGRGRTIHGASGLAMLAHGHYRDAGGRPDSVLVVAGVRARTVRDPQLLGWLRRAAATSRRLGAVCVGGFVLAAAGILDGRRATAHWRYARELAHRYPRVAVDPRPTWLQDGNVYTSAGISAGIDLALAWVEEDLGTAAASAVARELVLFLRRPGGQDQLSLALAAQASHTRSMNEVRVWMTEHLHEALSVDTLAARAAMSPRNFARVFAREVGTTPAHYLGLLRVEAARRLLEQSDTSLAAIAASCGFGGADVMRRAFVRDLGVTPRRYREPFRVPAIRDRVPAAAPNGPLAPARREIARAARILATRTVRRGAGESGVPP
jgi:transcriptional regulator GlxA family with amidase domain